MPISNPSTYGHATNANTTINHSARRAPGPRYLIADYIRLPLEGNTCALRQTMFWRYRGSGIRICVTLGLMFYYIVSSPIFSPAIIVFMEHQPRKRLLRPEPPLTLENYPRDLTGMQTNVPTLNSVCWHPLQKKLCRPVLPRQILLKITGLSALIMYNVFSDIPAHQQRHRS
jgi:hypothetical protein